LALGFGMLLVFVLLVGAAGIGGMSRLNDRVNAIVVYNNAKLGFAQSFSRALVEQEKGLLGLVLASSAEQRDQALTAIKYQASQYDDAKKGLVEILGLSKPTEREANIVEKINGHEATATPLVAKVMKLVGDDDTEGALKVLQSDVKPALGKWVTDIDELVSIEQRLNDQAATDTAKDYVWLRNFSLACIALAVAFGALVSLFITRGLRRDLGGEPSQATQVATQVAAGDLSLAIPVRTGDTSSLMAALKGTVEQLSNILRTINAATDTINIGASEIASGNSDLSKRTEEQAAALEQTAASMEQLTATVKQNADNARQANQLAAGASDVAIKGGQVVDKVVATMTSINDSSKKIVDIISVIDGIAFQTNILALNAAVEAARAGEQGRGFAVVASEVRSLAQRSSEAAKQIKVLITESVLKVEGGSKLVDEAGATMGEIVSAVKRVTDIMAEITVASHEQSNGISQVNTAIAQMDQSTQRNAALVEQAAAAADSMRQQAQSLAQTVSVFRLSAVPASA
jgi:methyl-accepting chemotaxis protein